MRITRKPPTKGAIILTKPKPKVSPAVKQYVKKVTNGLVKRTSDELVTESSVNTLTLFYMDGFMTSSRQWANRTPDQKVYSRGLKIRYVLHSNSTTVPMSVRCMVIVNHRGQSEFGSYRSGSNIFERADWNNSSVIDANYSISGTTQDIVGRLNNEHYTALRDFTVTLGTSAGDAKNVRSGSLWIPYRKALSYDIASLTSFVFPERDNLAFIILPRESPNDPSTGQTLEVTASATWYYSMAN